MRLIYLLFLSIYLTSLTISFGQEGLQIPEGQFQIDNSKKLILVSKRPDHISLPQSFQLGSQVFSSAAEISSIESGVPYTIQSHTSENFTLYFVDHPIVSFSGITIGQINRTDEVLATMTLASNDYPLYTSSAGVRIRGASSAAFPKKSYRVQLKDENGKNKHESLLGLRSDRRWLMLAMYNEPMRVNNKFSHDLWLDLHKLYYADEAPDAHSTIRSRYVEAFINGEYRGVYLFTEDADAKQFGLKSDGELYKGDDRGVNNLFNKNYHLRPNNDYPEIAPEGDELWGGWELRYPDQTNWQNLYDFTAFVIDTPDDVFSAEVENRLYLESVIDYYIFLNLLRATDNAGKNTHLIRYGSGEPYFYGVWDLDGVVGIQWDGARIPETNGILGNGLTQRLINTNAANYRWRLSTRWKNLRQNLLSTQNFKSRYFNYFNYLKSQGVFERELLVRASDGNWNPNLLKFDEEQEGYVNNWIDNRFAFLDNYFEDMYQTALPVRLTNFKLGSEENLIRIEWQTADAQNVSHFVVEHSRDASHWTEIASVPFSESTNFFSAIHTTPAQGTNYYRLKTMDIDKTFEYSTIKSILHHRGYNLSISPNPVGEHLNIKSSAPNKEPRSIHLYNMMGIRVLSSKLAPSRSVHVGNIPTGVYVAAIELEDGSIEKHTIIVGAANVGR